MQGKDDHEELITENPVVNPKNQSHQGMQNGGYGNSIDSRLFFSRVANHTSFFRKSEP